MGEASDKGLPGDYVTEVDLASERAIREMLEAATPGIPVLGEERGGEPPTAPGWWIRSTAR